MAKKRTAKAGPATRRRPARKEEAAAAPAVTPERAARLHRLLKLLGAGPQTREALTKKLKLDVRGFYRDLELLRSAGIVVALNDHHYVLEAKAKEAIACLPCPDPHLTLGEATQLAKGRTKAHRKLKDLLAQIVG